MGHLFCKHILYSLWTYDKMEVVGRAYYILV